MPIFRKDPCGIICMIITYGAVFYADYVVIRWIIMTSFYDSLWGCFHLVAFNIVVAFLTAAHMRAVLSDPGIVPLSPTKIDFSDHNTKTLKERNSELEGEAGAWTICSRCEAFRPPRAHHCRICNRCIRRMDHHCPWINNCVGEWNQKYFMQFLIYVGILCLYASALVVYSWVTVDCPFCPQDTLIKQTRVLHSVILMLESLLFGMFVMAIMIDQLSAVFSDETAVEHVKKLGRHRPRKPRMTLLSEICGRGPVLLWVLPCHSAPLGIEQVNNYHV
ncbi:unnamed protein product [Allacma fusca]|uniref:Palmitoyltransferase n=1 Tax=Allacma fusca TaxID=39272 RepID=A0A8J2JY87_9HEXA|nr:unnamed protein product [Allacma fusca]